MGLRFRRSVTLCKGVKLNFGKTGMSVSMGSKGFHKTFHQNGNVTTSVGLPGTGIYWTDTKRAGKESNNKRNNYVETSSREIISDVYSVNDSENLMVQGIENDEWVEHVTSKEETKHQNYYMDDALAAYFSQNKDNIDESGENIVKQDRTEVYDVLSKKQIYDIYKTADAVVDWTEILVSTTSEDVYLEERKWKVYKSFAKKILKGDIDAYLDVIEYAKPLDDLLDFGGEFEFGTDSASVMEIEFRIKTEDILGEDYSEELFCDYVFATCIRVARDILSLLPVGIVPVHAMRDNQTILSVLFNRNEMEKVNFSKCPQDIIKHFRHNFKSIGGVLQAVDRVGL